MHCLILCFHWAARAWKLKQASSAVKYQNKPVAPPARMTEESFQNPTKLSFGGIYIEHHFLTPLHPASAKFDLLRAELAHALAFV